jgi:hypothetical protein
MLPREDAMNRKIKKLNLHRDTMRLLVSDDLKALVGGVSAYQCSDLEPCHSEFCTQLSNCCR